MGKKKKKSPDHTETVPVCWNTHEHFIAGSVLFALSYLFVVGWFQFVNVWEKHFADPGFVYIVYHLFKVVFLLFIAWLIYYSGRVLFGYFMKKREYAGWSGIDAFLISSFLGAALWTVVMFFLGLSKLYYLSTVLILTVPVIFLSYPDFKGVVSGMPGLLTHWRNNWASMNKGGKALFSGFLLVIFVQFLYLLIVKGLSPDLVTNDTVGHYMPYFQEVINSHSTWMNKFTFHYFMSRGSGLFFLAALLTDVQSIQLVSFYFMILTGLVLCALVGRITDDWPWVLLAACLYFSTNILISETGLIVAEFQKSHVMIGAFVVFMTYMTTLAFAIPAGCFSAWCFFQIFIATTGVIISPVSFVFIFPYLIFQGALFMLLKREPLLKLTTIAIVVTSTVFLSLLGFNYLSSGLAELTPLPLFFEYRNESILSRWVSPLSLLSSINIAITSGEGAGGVGFSNLLNIGNYIQNFKLVFYDDAMAPIVLFIMLLLLTGITFMVSLKKKFFPEEALYSISSILFMLFTAFLLFSVNKQHSLYRYTFFLAYFKIAFYVFLLVFLTRIFSGGAILKRNIVLAITATALLFSVVNFFRLTSSSASGISLEDRIKFLFGLTSYAELYNKKWEVTNIGLNVKKVVGKDAKVVPLNFFPGLYGIPNGGFQRPFMCDYNKSGDFESVLFGPPEKAMETLKKYRINYFLIVSVRPLLFTVFAPLFEPQAVKQYFKLVGTGENTLLLTWRAETDPPISDAILTQYEQVRDANRTNSYAQAYDMTQKAYLRLVNENIQSGSVIQN